MWGEVESMMGCEAAAVPQAQSGKWSEMCPQEGQEGVGLSYCE